MRPLSNAVLAGLMTLLFGSPAFADPTYVTFDAPDANAAGTTVSGMNKKGDVTGAYAGQDGMERAFIRFANGSFVEVGQASDNILT
ncbi:MAG TPA: hypothetical protein VHE09_08265, partial [Rhizomicrobium sp.]|nr:hypothetical protein [Rhizomicrobium sp.]